MHRQELLFLLTTAIAISAELGAFFGLDSIRNARSPAKLSGWAVPVF